MPVDVRTEIEIARPPGEVAAYACDPDNAPAWYVNIAGVAWETPPPLAVGSRLAFVANFLGRRLAYTYEVVEFAPGERLVMRTSQGPFPMETTYTWAAAPGGATLMTLRNRGEPAGFKRTVAPFMAAAMRRANTKDLRQLKTIMEAADVVVVHEQGRNLMFTFDEILRFHDGGSPGGVAIAFRALQRALPLLADSGRVERREVGVRTAFGGPGARDGFEAVLRAVTDGRYALDPSLARPALGIARERFVFVVTHRARTITLVLRDGIASEELVSLARTDPRTAAQEARLTEVKDELRRRVMARAAGEVFDVERQSVGRAQRAARHRRAPR